ncbi:helix-turn-helix transcriptional regulator [bacterium]|nr:helix-turn-helix transcriptional regulator [bacterium]
MEGAFFPWPDTNLPPGLSVWAYGVQLVKSDGTMLRSGSRRGAAIRLVTHGEGFLQIGGEEYALTAGSLFALRPQVPFVFGEKPGVPWQFYTCQIGGEGLEEFLSALNLLPERPIARVSDMEKACRCFSTLMDYYALPQKDAWQAAVLFLELGKVLRGRNLQNLPVTHGELVRRATRVIHDQIEAGIGVDNLARMLHVSRVTLNRVFQAELDMPPGEYLRQARLRRAKYLLTVSDQKLSAIAAESGFRNEKFFYRCFKKATGFTPRQWREKQP